jgi:hypothetical protein
MTMGRPYLGTFMLVFNQTMPHMVPAVMFGLTDGCCAGMESGVSLAAGHVIIVESRLKQKMQIWPYSLRRNPRVYLEQAPSRTYLACSAQPTGSRGNGSVVYRPGRAKAPRRDKNGE